jgi:hypothetical protein
MTEEISRAGIFSLLRDFKKKDRQEEGLRIIGTEHIANKRGPDTNLPDLLVEQFLNCRKY